MPERRQRSEQYKTLPQSLCHFLRHVKGLLQTLQVLDNLLITARSLRTLFNLRSGIGGTNISVGFQWILFL